MPQEVFLASIDEVNTLIANIKSSERMTVTAPSAAKFTYTFPLAYKSPPNIYSFCTWTGTTQYSANVENITATNCQITVMRSRATIIITDSPFEVAPAGSKCDIQVVGVHV